MSLRDRFDRGPGNGKAGPERLLRHSRDTTSTIEHDQGGLTPPHASSSAAPVRVLGVPDPGAGGAVPRFGAGGESPQVEGHDPVRGQDAVALEQRVAEMVSERTVPMTSGSGRRIRQPATPVQRALGLLTRREHSGRELTRKLTARGIEAAEAKAAVDTLAAAGWQDDVRFAESLVRSRANNGYGPLRIRAELATHGLEEAVISDALARYEGDFDENACTLARRKLGAAPLDLTARRKLSDLLLRRGFSGEQARAVLEALSRRD